MISAKIIQDSVTLKGDRITTFELEYPRFIHSELMTHRQFSRNAASSRAVPIERMIKHVHEHPAEPVHWGKNQPGMQAKVELEGEELAKMKESAVLFNETLLATKTGVTISGIEPMNGSDAYAVVDGDTTYYFDVKSGLKTAESSTEEQGGQKMTRVTNYNDYRAVKGVKVPFNTIMNVGFELDIKMSDVKINEDVSDADFQ